MNMAPLDVHRRGSRETIPSNMYLISFTCLIPAFLFQSAFCTELFVAIKNVRDADGRPITDTLQRAPSRRNEPDYYNIVEKAIDLSRINQKVNAEEYNSFEEICGDIELLVRNTISFYKVSFGLNYLKFVSISARDDRTSTRISLAKRLQHGEGKDIAASIRRTTR